MNAAALSSAGSIVLSIVIALIVIAFGIRAWKYMGREKHHGDSTPKTSRGQMSHQVDG